MALSIGAISAIFTADTKGFVKDVADAKKRIDDFGKDVKQGASIIEDGLKNIGGKISLFVTAPLVGAFGLVSKAAIDQVSQVQGATISLRAYEKDATKVTKVLSELVAFAQSDMGVLFQRQDLFDAASTLKIFGLETDTLTDRIKIMSRGVAIGKTTFQELSTILGRVSATGKLTSTDFDMLIERGIGLDKSMRGTSVSADELFQALDKSLPAELLEGRANTIEGGLIRLRSAMRNLGMNILGVNKEVDGFLPNSLGKRIFTTIENIRQFLRSKEVIEAVTQAGERLGQVFDIVSKKVENLWSWFISLSAENKKLITDFVLVVAALGPLLVIIGSVIGIVGGAISSFGFLFVILNKIIWVVGFVIGIFVALNPVVLIIIGVVTALIGVGIALWANWEWVSQKLIEAWNYLKDVVQRALDGLSWAIQNWQYVLGWVLGWLLGTFVLSVIGVWERIKNAFWGLVKAVDNGVNNFWLYLLRLNQKLNSFNLWAFLDKGFKEAEKFIMDGLKRIVNEVTQLPSKIGKATTGMWGNLTKGIGDGLSSALKGKIPGFATGVRNFGGGFAEINERGPEAIGIGDLVYLPKGADVFTNSETKDMMRGSGSNITNNFTVNNLADAEYLSRRLALQLRTN
jgi:phage-related protein